MKEINILFPLKYLLIVLCFITSYVASAQNGCFKAYHEGKEVSVFCVGQTIRFKDCTGQVSPEHEYYFVNDEDRNNPNKDTSKVFTPTTPGHHIIAQFVNMQGTRYFFTQSFEVKANPEPKFLASICANRTVRITITDRNYDSYEIDFGNGETREMSPDQSFNYTYTSEGPYQITLTGSFPGGNCTNSSTQRLENIPALQEPVLSELFTVRQGEADGSLRITLEGITPGYFYLLEKIQPSNNSVISSDTIRGIRQAGSHTFTKENTNTSEAACYRVRVTDVCGNNKLSNTLCTIVLQAIPGNEQASISWSTFPVPQHRLELYRGTTRILSPQTQQNSYTDANLECGQEYCYSMRSLSANGSATVISATQCVSVSSTSAPPAGQLISTYNNTNEVELSLQVPQGQTFKKLTVHRNAGGNPQPLGTSGTTTFTDKLSSPAAYCYQATYTDSCEGTSATSNSTCPMLLTVRQQDETGVMLQWSAFTGFQGGVQQYEVELLDQNFTVTGSFPATGTTFTHQSPPDDQRLRYRVKATSRTGSTISYSNIIEVAQPIKLFIPSGFTPNNDDLNDTFTVKGKFYERFSIRIYNRSGQVVYQSTNATEGWDGTYNGQQQPAGAYVYEIEVTAADGEKKNRKGTVTLIR